MQGKPYCIVLNTSSLFRLHGLGGVDAGDEEGGDEEQEEDAGEGGGVCQEDGGQVDVHRHEGNEIILRIEFDRVGNGGADALFRWRCPQTHQCY